MAIQLHMKALCRKNLITWKRQWFVSMLEVLMPIACMFAVGAFKGFGQTKVQSEQDFLHFGAAQFPVTQLRGIHWEMIEKQPQMLEDFLEFSGISSDEQEMYRRNPLYFFPAHCYNFRNETRITKELEYPSRSGQTKNRNATIIGYVEHGNRVETAFLEQLRQVLKTQRYLVGPDQFHYFQLEAFANKETLDLYLNDPDYGYDRSKPQMCFAFEIKRHSDFRYDVRLFYNDQIDRDYFGSGIPKQNLPSWSPIRNSADLTSFDKYVHGGYSIMQNWIANTILRQLGYYDGSIAMVIIPAKTPAYDYDSLMKEVMTEYLPLFTVLMFIVPVFRFSYRMVAEKETRARESMQMMGLTEFAYWSSWLVYYTATNTFISTASTIILCTTLLKFSHYLLVFAYFWLYGMSVFGFILFCQAFFERARYAAIFTSVVYVSLSFGYFLVSSADTPESTKIYASLVPQIAIRLLSVPFAGFESVGIGLTFSNVGMLFQNYKVYTGFQMLLLDLVIYSFLGIYIDNIMPRQYGHRLSPFYPCQRLTPSYWDCWLLCFRKKQRGGVLSDGDAELNRLLKDKRKTIGGGATENMENFETKYMNKDNFEPPGQQLLALEEKNRFLKISNLFKQYENGFLAVNGINVRMYEGQIFALLGHNGAGKTTTIQMLTGMLQPSKGNAVIFNQDIFNQGLDYVRSFMGVCPQHDILFDLLNPVEHLSVFIDFKGATYQKAQDKQIEIEKLVKDVGLWEYRDTMAKNLSGGSKRKLSVAIALCGNSRFVLLDEPTSGMDLQARRGLWNMLRRYRDEKIIILTTHYMDEADVLGDRIGIMANGRLVCLGHSLFLKKKFGYGYNLVLVKEDGNDDTIDRKMRPFLNEHLNTEVNKLSEVGKEITYQISPESSGSFKTFFEKFDTWFQEQGIASYSISISTLEEVFLRVGHQQESEDLLEGGQDEKDAHYESSESMDEDPTKIDQIDTLMSEMNEQLDNYSVAASNDGGCCQSTVAVTKKRCIMYGRSPVQLIFEIAVPVLLVTIGFALTSIQFFFNSEPRWLQTKLYPLRQHILMNTDPVITSDYEDVLWSRFSNRLDDRKRNEIMTRTPSLRSMELGATLGSIKIKEPVKFWPSIEGLLPKNTIQKLYKNLPSSYTLPGDDDFNVTWANYTDQLVIGQNQTGGKPGLTARKKIKIPNKPLKRCNTFKNQTLKATCKGKLKSKKKSFTKKKVVGFDLLRRFDEDFFKLRFKQNGATNKIPGAFGSYLVYEANSLKQQYKVITYVNTTSQDVAAAYPQFMYESILRVASGNSNFQFKMHTEPFPILQKYKDADRVTSNISLILVLSVGLAVLPATVIGHLLYEREKKLKHLQVISGLNLFAYWLINLLFDLWRTFIPLCLMALILWLFGLKDLYQVIPLFLLYPVAIIPTTYASSFFFQSEMSAQGFTVFFNLIASSLCPIAIFILKTSENYMHIGDKYGFYLRILPSYSLSNALLFAGSGAQIAKVRQELREQGKILPSSDDGSYFSQYYYSEEKWSIANLKGDFYAMIAHGIIGIFFILLFEGLLCQSCWLRQFARLGKPCIKKQRPRRRKEDGDTSTAAEEIDSDVDREEERVKKAGPGKLQLKVDQFRKVYQLGPCKQLVAVDGASFGLSFGDCFTLLGVNGAGKTTTFKSLTNEIIPSSGNVSIAGKDVQSNFGEIRKQIGFCPQENIIFDMMSVEEHLDFYARVKGVKPRLRVPMIKRTINMLSLNEHRKKLAFSLSGGNKRKLQVAISIIGNPPIVLLDEPSAGMDPEARRFMWQVVKGLSQRANKSAVILTTHSMEEAEALSTKMGIMVTGGVFRCFGSVQQIKEKFGVGFEIEFKIGTLSEARRREYMQKYQLGQFMRVLTLNDCRKVMAEESPLMATQFTEDGLGAPIWREAMEEKSRKQKVSMRNFVHWVHVMHFGKKVIMDLCEVFGRVELLEQHSEQFKVRVLRQGKTIGSVFGQMESKKVEFGTQEYSVSQTTLEQIFQMFAKVNLHDEEASGNLVFSLDRRVADKMTIERSKKLTRIRDSMQRAFQKKILANTNSTHVRTAIKAQMPSIIEEDELGEDEEHKNSSDQNKSSSVMYNNPTNNPLFTEKKEMVGFEGAENPASEGTPLNRREGMSETSTKKSRPTGFHLD